MRNPKLTGFTLMEVIAALVIAAAVAATSIQFLRPPSETGKQRSCDFTREIMQNDAHRYQGSTGRMPSADLRELRTAQYSGADLPTCPATGESYSRDSAGTITCPTHEVTRVK